MLHKRSLWTFGILVVLLGSGGGCQTNSTSPEAIHRDKFTSTLTPLEDYIIGTWLLLVGFVSVVGNGLSIVVFNGSSNKEVNPAEMFLFNVAVVNLLLAVASYPAATVSSFAHKWVFGEIGCTIYGAVCYFLGLATILSLTALAVVRYLKTCVPKIGNSINRRNARIIIIIIYLYALMWAVFPFLGWGGYEVEPFGTSCTLNWHNFSTNGRSHIICLSLFCVFLPTLAITISHAAIVFQVRKAEAVLPKDMGKQTCRAERQLFRMSWAISLGFLVAWLPYACFSLWSAFGDSSAIPTWATPIPVMLAKSSIAYNPIIYVVMTKRYRTEFKDAACRVLRLKTNANGAKSKRNAIANLEAPTAATAVTNIEITRRLPDDTKQERIDEDQESSDVVAVDDLPAKHNI